MDWRLILVIVLGVFFLGLVVLSIVLSVKLLNVRDLALERWAKMERAHRKVEDLEDEIERMQLLEHAKGMDDDEAVDSMHSGIADWTPDDTGDGQG